MRLHKKSDTIRGFTAEYLQAVAEPNVKAKRVAGLSKKYLEDMAKQDNDLASKFKSAIRKQDGVY